jgi:hypothetical protein
MKILIYDCFSGISGDMNLGAMIDLGVDKEYLAHELGKLNLSGWELLASEDQRHGIRGIKVTVKQTRHEHEHRHFDDVKKIICNSTLDLKTRDLSMKIFMKIAAAEALVHGVAIEKVHFHEVGAIDSIIDIVGAAICYNSLGVDSVYTLPVELGGGLAVCEHGTIPVPAPATAEIIKGFPVRTGGVDFEATTPTGAAILATLIPGPGKVPSYRIIKTGYGAGQKEHAGIPNLLRVFLAMPEESHSGHESVLLECNIDDMNPEFYEHLSGKLFRAGASDVYITGIIMKKGRPGNMLSVICEPGCAEAMKQIIFTESTSLGIRSLPFMKETLSRKPGVINSPYGEVRIKRSFYKDTEVSCKPEFDDCARIATEQGLPVKEVFNKIMALITGTSINEQ